MSDKVTQILTDLGLSDYGNALELPGAYGPKAFGLGDRSPDLISYSPTNGRMLGRIVSATDWQYEQVMQSAQRAFARWRLVPAPRRGEFIRAVADELRRQKPLLGALVSIEMGKIRSEGLGEVQEMIDIADYAVGLSRMFGGITVPSELPFHNIRENWHPLGVVGVITAFNFPVAVWSWNSFIAAVCGDTVVWKPSSETPLCAIAVQNICNRVAAQYDAEGVFNTVIGKGFGERLADDKRVQLVSFTGSTETGRTVAQRVAKRLGRYLLELGGNNAVAVMNSADLRLATRAIAFGGAGTTGQRCTSTRRVFAQKGIASELIEQLVTAYASMKIGDPLDPSVHVGPLVSREAMESMGWAIRQALAAGGKLITVGGNIVTANRDGHFVGPVSIEADPSMSIVQLETFAPILYVMRVNDMEEAIALNNSASHGLSSAIFTRDLAEAETFLSAAGSDCGIANVNNGTSGAEIGGAFGGEKDTGGGREAGSDSWKAYMRRQTCRVNYGQELPLAQGVKFGS